jgi:hypothetical protein
MKLTESRLKKGKSVEHGLISELLKRGLDVYLPVVDTHGIDILVRSRSGKTAEVQVKSRVDTGQQGRYFAVGEVKSRQEGSFFVCLCMITDDLKPDEYWIIPWDVYSGIAQFNKGTNKYRLTIGRILKNEKEMAKFKTIKGIRTLHKYLEKE